MGEKSPCFVIPCVMGVCGVWSWNIYYQCIVAMTSSGYNLWLTCYSLSLQIEGWILACQPKSKPKVGREMETHNSATLDFV